MRGFNLFLKIKLTPVYNFTKTNKYGKVFYGGIPDGFYEQRYAKTQPANYRLRYSNTGNHKFPSHHNPPSLDVSLGQLGDGTGKGTG